MEESLSGSAEPQHVAPAVVGVAGAGHEAAFREVGGDCGEVAVIDAQRVGELGLARLAERLELLEDDELLGAEAEGTHRAAHARLEFGLDTFAPVTVDASGEPVRGDQVIRNTVEEAVLAEAAGIDSFNIGEHYRPDFMDMCELLLAR